MAESIFQLTIASILQFNKININLESTDEFKSTERFSWFFGIFCIILVLGVTASFISLIFGPAERLEDVSLQTKYGHLLQRVKPGSKITVGYILWFLLRRILTIMVCMFIAIDHTGIQLQIIMMLNLVSLIYAG